MPKWKLYGKLNGIFYRTSTTNNVFCAGSAMSMIVIRIDSQGQLADSKPCANCTKMLKYYGLKKIYYSVPGGLVVQNVNQLTNDHLSYAQKVYDLIMISSSKK